MQCPNCQTENHSQSKFCCECGAKITESGSAPNTERQSRQERDKLRPVPNGKAGVETIAPATAASETERRFATIIFADLVGYTTLAETMDPEEVHTLIDRIFSQFDKVIKDKNGYVDRYMGDALMAVFGVPQAAEDDPDRAVQTALSIREELKKVSASFHRDLAIRIGINTGEVLWGRAGGGSSTVWGDTVNVAQRLQSSASINSIIISQATKNQLKGGFRLNQIPSLKLKGKEQFVQAYEVIGIEETKLPAAVPFIGRKEQLELLQTGVEQIVKEKKPFFILISGEAGVGKSRLLSEFSNFLNNAPYEFRIFTERCLPHAQLPYDPLAEIIRHYFDLTDLSFADAQSRLEKEAGRLFPDSPLSHHFLGFFLGMKYPDSPLVELTPDAARTSAFNVLKKLLERAATEVQGLILIIEDIQWSDVGTKDFLDYLSEITLTESLMIVVTARIQENINVYLNHIKELSTRSQTRWKTLGLTPFSKEVTIQFINTILKHSRITRQIAEELWIKTGGNPLFLEELIRGLAEDSDSGELSEDERKWTLPENIWQIIESRVDRLTEAEKKAIKAASVFGRIFWEQGLQQCLNQPVREILISLESKGFIVRDTESLYKNDYEYTFRHELIRDVTYRMLLKKERVNFHQIVLDFIKTKRKNNELNEELYLKLGSYHAEESGNFDMAIELYEAYGDYENNRYMLDEALWVYHKVGELADNITSKDIAFSKARLIDKEARIYHQLSKYREAIERYERLKNEPPHWSWRVKGLIGIADVYEKQSDYEQTFRYAGEAAEISFHGKNNRLLGQALNLVALSLIGRGLYSGAAKLAERIKTTFTQAISEEPVSGSLTPAELSEIKKELATAFNNTGLIEWYQGDYESALEAYESALKIMQEINNRYGIAASYINIGNVRRDQGNYQSALDYYQKSLTNSQMIGSRRGVAVAFLNIGAIYHDQGDYQRANEYFLQSLALVREINAKHEETVALTSLGNLYHDQGEYGQALKTHLESLPLKRQLAEKSELVITLLNVATLFFERGDYNDAAPLIAEAEEVATQVKAKMEIITSLNTLGRMLVYFALLGGLPNLPKTALFSKAREYVTNALKMAKTLNLRTQTLEATTSLALTYIQETISAEGPAITTQKQSKNHEAFFQEAYKLLKEAENLLPYIHHKESHIHYYFAWGRYYLEFINRLNKKSQDEATKKEIQQATEEAIKITTQSLNLTQELGLRRLQPEAMFLYVQALSLSGEKAKAANYYENCRQLAEMMGLKPFLRMTARMPV